ncbi:hypothetical protein ACFE04_021911 [Oxalis oulophora]
MDNFTLMHTQLKRYNNAYTIKEAPTSESINSDDQLVHDGFQNSKESSFGEPRVVNSDSDNRGKSDSTFVQLSYIPGEKGTKVPAVPAMSAPGGFMRDPIVFNSTKGLLNGPELGESGGPSASKKRKHSLEREVEATTSIRHQTRNKNLKEEARRKGAQGGIQGRSGYDGFDVV